MSPERPLQESGQPARQLSWLSSGRFALLLGLLVVGFFPGVLLRGETFIIRDFGAFSCPVAWFQREHFWRGEWPLWNTLNFCGTPFLAQWNTMVLYPPTLIYLLLPFPWSLSFFCLVHLFWGGLGMYLLARSWTGNSLGAALAGVIFAFNGLTLNLLMWPSHVATFSWVPWVLWLGPRAWRHGGRSLVWAIAAAALQMLAGGPETIAFTWFLLGLFAIGDWRRDCVAGTVLIWRFGTMGMVVAFLCAAQLLPFLELLSQSARSSGYGAAGYDWSMPPWGWANLLVPLFRECPTSQGVFFQLSQNWTSSYYAGIGTVFLAAAGAWRSRDWRARLALAVICVGLILALGDAGLLYRALRWCLPAIGFVRYPVKFVLAAIALLPLLVAWGVKELESKAANSRRLEFICAATLLLLVFGIVAWDALSPLPQDTWHLTFRSGLYRAGFLLLMLLALAGLLRWSGCQQFICGIALLLVFWADFFTHAPNQNPSAPIASLMPGWARRQLNWGEQPSLGQSRVMLAPEAEEALRSHALPSLDQDEAVKRLAMFANANLLDGVPQVYGFFSLSPAAADNLASLPYVQTQHAFPALMDFMSVSRVTAPGKLFDWVPRSSAMPIVTIGQRPIFAPDQAAIDAFFQTNSDFRQTVFLPAKAQGSITAKQQNGARVSPVEFQEERISMITEAAAPAMVVLSQSYYPAWKAYVDGRPVKLWRANYAFQALEVPAGRHEVKFIYQDNLFRVGLALASLGVLACIGLLLPSNSSSRKRRTF